MSQPAKRPTDDFSWLPERLSELGRGEQHLPPRRLRLEAAREEDALSAIAWGGPESRVAYLHGGGQNAHTWDLVAALVNEPALAIDLPGHGHSPWREDRDYGPSANAEAVAAAMDAGGLLGQLVVGMSLGGLTGLVLAAERPELVTELILVDVLPGIETTVADLDDDKKGQVALTYGRRSFGSLAEMEEATIRALGGARSRIALQRGVWHNAIQLRDGSWRWRYDDVHALGRRDTTFLWAVLKRLDAPITLVRGGMSGFVSDALVDRLREERPDAEIIVVPHAGHSVQSDAPDALAAVIASRGIARASEPEVVNGRSATQPSCKNAQ